MNRPPSWDTELYEAQHAFVWKFGEALVTALNPQPGERILDLGCGPGQLTQAIAERGACVLGLDASADMIGQARQNYPHLQFVLQNATEMQFSAEFDAIFSNAALHWMTDAVPVIENMARALRRGGRLIAEFGGKGNIGQIEEAVRAIIGGYLGHATPSTRTYFPALGEYAKVLEDHGFEVRFASLFDRPTPLEGEAGMEQWIRQFAFYYFEGLNTQQQNQALAKVIDRLSPTLKTENGWFADYRRLRLTAYRL